MFATAVPIPVLPILAVDVQLAGALMLIALFMLLRRFVVRRSYFGAWATAWVAFAAATATLVLRFTLMPAIAGGQVDDAALGTRLVYALYQMSKALGFAYLIRGTLMYVTGQTNSVVATKRFWAAAAIFGVVSAIAARHGVNELLLWQSVLAAPTLGYCAGAFLLLPRARRTAGSVSVGIGFALLTILWLLDAGAFAVSIGGGDATNTSRVLVSLDAYFELGLNFLLAYAMVLVLMEDNKREIDDAQAELRVTHDQLRRAALYDSLTDSLNRRAFAEGVGLEMVRTTFGTVVIADLDNLKWVNDRLGHAAGDQLIRHCADVLRSTLRSYDKLYRWGGDEFLLIVPSARAADVVDRLGAAIEHAVATAARGPHLQVSLGAASYTSFEGLDEAIDRADRAMYREKTRRKAKGFDPDSGRRSSGTPKPMAAVR